MKLSSKIFAVVGLLIVLALAILALGLYGFSQLSAALTGYQRRADRVMVLQDIDKAALALAVEEKNLILEPSDAGMREIMARDAFRNASAKFTALSEDLKQSVNAQSEDWVKALPAKVVEYGQKYDQATNSVAQIALEAGDRKAIEEMGKGGQLWVEYDNTVNPALDDAEKRWEAGDAAAAAQLIYLLRSVNLRYQFQIDARSIQLTTVTAERERLAARISATLTALADHFRSAPAKYPDNPQRGQALAGLTGVVQKLSASMDQVIAYLKLNSDARAREYSGTAVRQARMTFDDFTNEAIDKSKTQLQNLQRTTDATVSRLLWFMVISSLIGIVAVGIIAYGIVRGLNLRLTRTIDALDQGAEQVTSAANQISAASQSLAEGATQQAASLEETSSALEQVASMTRQNADNAERTNKTTSNTVRLISQGAVSVNNMSQAMGEINTSAEQINRIIKTIEDIAFQTNLLALNAAVEAARAGEAGKGFAVVADEVRNLAQRSAQAARDTTTLIEGTVHRVRNGSEIAASLDKGFKEIEDGSQSVGKLVTEISHANSEQAQGVDQVNIAVSQMDKVTQQNAAAAEESASASEELSAQADNLKGLVGDLLELVMGKGHAHGNGNGHAALKSSATRNISRNTTRQFGGPDRRLEPMSSQRPQVMTPNQVVSLEPVEEF